MDARRFIGDLLAAQTDEPRIGAVRAAVRAGTIDWPSIVNYASRHLIAAALQPAFVAHDLLDELDSEVRDYFTIVADLNRQRNHEVMRQAADVARALSAAGIAPVFLKGVAHLLRSIYQDPCERVIADIDLLVPEPSEADAVAALQSIGYAPDPQDDLGPHHHHLPLLIHQGGLVGVEIHREVLPRLYAKSLPATAVLAEAKPMQANGVSALVPSTLHLVVHNIMNSQRADRKLWSAEIGLREAYDFSLLSARCVGETSWQRVLDEAAAAAGRSCAAFYIRAVDEIFGPLAGPPPPATISASVNRWRWQLHDHGQAMWLQDIARVAAARAARALAASTRGPRRLSRRQ